MEGYRVGKRMRNVMIVGIKCEKGRCNAPFAFFMFFVYIPSHPFPSLNITSPTMDTPSRLCANTVRTTPHKRGTLMRGPQTRTTLGTSLPLHDVALLWHSSHYPPECIPHIMRPFPVWYSGVTTSPLFRTCVHHRFPHQVFRCLR